MTSSKPQILLTNDDGIQSPGLWAAAEALSHLGYVNVVAPREQSTGAGRSLPNYSDGIINPKKVDVQGQAWTAYAVGGTPAQAVLHACLEILEARPALLVSGINYGENVGTGITISGTVGAALEGAAFEIPALAISLETAKAHHLSYSDQVDFSTAAYFTQLFGRMLLQMRLPEDVDVLKVDVPASATPDTPWRITRLSRKKYYESIPPRRDSWGEPASIDYRLHDEIDRYDPDSDVYVLRKDGQVAVTPLSLDLTSRVDLGALEEMLRG